MTTSTVDTVGGEQAARRTPYGSGVPREVGHVLLAFLVYNLGRLLATHGVDRADLNAHRVLDVQGWLRLPAEASVQSWALGHEWLVELADRYYVSVHFPLTIAVLIWLYRRRRPAYTWAKRGLLVATGAGMVVHILLPVTPPRLLPGLGMVDTAHAGGQSIYEAPMLGSLSNQYAAMPSMHVGWAVLIAVVLIATGRSAVRWLWLLHPLATLFVVVGTANHYWVDGLAGTLLVLVALWLCRPVSLRGPSST